MIQKYRNIGAALAIFVGHGHAGVFFLIPLLGLVGAYPRLNLLEGLNSDIGTAIAVFAVAICLLAKFLGQGKPLQTGAWLTGMLSYCWLAASAAMRPAPVALWEYGRNGYDQLIMLPFALWAVSVAVLVIGFLIMCVAMPFGFDADKPRTE